VVQFVSVKIHTVWQKQIKLLHISDSNSRLVTFLAKIKPIF
jgi:hypothetical protein